MKETKRRILRALEGDNTRKVIKYPVKAEVKIYFGKLVEKQEIEIISRCHLTSLLGLGISMGNKQGNFPDKIEIFDNKGRLIGEGKV